MTGWAGCWAEGLLILVGVADPHVMSDCLVSTASQQQLVGSCFAPWGEVEGPFVCI